VVGLFSFYMMKKAMGEKTMKHMSTIKGGKNAYTLDALIALFSKTRQGFGC
jgi:hypothetical protein